MSHTPSRHSEYNTNPTPLDNIDRAILNLLQDDATLPLKSIAQRTGVSLATCGRRIKELTDSGVIQRQVAILDPTKVGYQLTVLVLVKMAHANTSMQHRFERQMMAEPQVVSCYEISGDYDFVLMVHSPTMQDYHAFTRAKLTGDNNVAHFNSQFVMNFVKSTAKLTL